MNDHQSKLMNQSQMINQPKVMNQSSLLKQPNLMNPMSMSMPPQMMNQQQQQSKPLMNPPMSSQQMMNQQQSKPVMNQAMSSQQMMMSRGVGVGVGVGGGGYGMWPLPPPHPGQVQEQLSYNPNVAMNFPGFNGGKTLGRNNWKGKKGIINDNKRRKGKGIGVGGSGGSGVGAGGGGGYKPPNIKELQQENRLKARKYFQKKKFGGGGGGNRSAPYAPRNTSSFIIRAKKSGGIASLVSPCPVTPAVLPTPMFSPSTEVLGDMAKEEWGVDGYGSMNGLIRLRSPGDVAEDEEDEEGGGSSESDVEEHLEVERRLDHDLSRFEMIYPNYGVEYNNVLENRVDDQDTHIAQVEEENLILKERLFLMERELNDLRRRLLSLERQHQGTEEINEEIVENESENDNGSRGEYSHSQEENNEEVIEENNEGGGKNVESKEEDNNVDDMVKDLNIVEAKKDNNNINNFGVEVNDGNNVETEVGNDIANVEVKEANAFETLNDAVVQDVCMGEVEPKQDGVNEEKVNL